MTIKDSGLLSPACPQYNEDSLYNLLTFELLLRKESDGQLSFPHDSIPSFLIIYYLFKSFMFCRKSDNYSLFINCLKTVSENRVFLPEDSIDFLSFFLSTSSINMTDKAFDVLNYCLSDGFIDGSFSSFSVRTAQNIISLCFYNAFRFLSRSIFESDGHITNHSFIKNLCSDSALSFQYLLNLPRFKFQKCLSTEALKTFDFDGAQFSNIVFDGEDFSRKKMTRQVMSGCSFRNVRLSAAYCVNSEYYYCDFSDDTICHNTDFSDSTLVSCNFNTAQLNGANFTNAVLDYSDLRQAILTKVKFSNTSLKRVKFNIEDFKYFFQQGYSISSVLDCELMIYENGHLLSKDDLPQAFERHFQYEWAFYKSGLEFNIKRIDS